MLGIEQLINWKSQHQSTTGVFFIIIISDNFFSILLLKTCVLMSCFMEASKCDFILFVPLKSNLNKLYLINIGMVVVISCASFY